MILKLGSKNEDVIELQKKLKILGYYGSKLDGVFGLVTEQAVKLFQKKYDLKVDGIVGPKTMQMLLEKTQENVVLEAPAKLKRPRNYPEVYKIFGDPLQNAWSSTNLDYCFIPDSFKCFPLVKGKRAFTTHKLMIPVFESVFKEINRQGLAPEIYSYDGCFNLRKIRGSIKMLSLHSWGIAIDINYAGNELGNSSWRMPKPIIRIFEHFGFYHGANFKRVDATHFEYFDRS